MKLIFEWIETLEEKNVYGRHQEIYQGVNFSNEYRVTYSLKNNRLDIKKNEDYFLNGFFNKDGGRSVEQISCIVGANGAGKSSLLRHLFKTDCNTLHDKYTETNLPFWRTIQVIEYDGKLKVFYNIPDLSIVCREYHEKYDCSKYPLPDYVVGEEFGGDYHNTSKIFMTNDYYGYINHDSSGNVVNKVAFTLYDLGVLKSQFYEICAIKEVGVYLNDWFHRYNEILLKNKRPEQLQSVFDLLLLRQIKILHKEDDFRYFNRFKLMGTTLIDITNLKDPKLKFPEVKWKELQKQIITGQDETLKAIEREYNVTFGEYGYDEIITYMMIDYVAELNGIDIRKVYDITTVQSLYFFFEVELRMAMLEFEERAFIDEKCDLDELIDAFVFAMGSELSKSGLEKKYIDRKLKQAEYLEFAFNSVNELNDIISENGGNEIFEKEKSDKLLDFIYDQVMSKRSFVLKHLYVDGLTFSAGERAFLNIFSWINASNNLVGLFPLAQESLHKHILLLLDEPDLYCHPKWQKKMVSELIGMCNMLLPDKKIHLIYSTHSPISLSDVPKSNVIRINEDRSIICGDDLDETFGANIFDLFRDNYFLDSFIGDFATEKINAAITVIKDLYLQLMLGEMEERLFKNREQYDRYQSAKQIVKLIGEPLLKKKLDEMTGFIDSRGYRG